MTAMVRVEVREDTETLAATVSRCSTCHAASGPVDVPQRQGLLPEMRIADRVNNLLTHHT